MLTALPTASIMTGSLELAYDVVGNRDKVDETSARIPVGSPICLRSEHTRMYLK